MTDPQFEPDEAWALASAYVDDAVDGHERAIVDGDPELQALVAEIRGVRARLAEPLAPPAAARTSALAAALALSVDSSDPARTDDPPHDTPDAPTSTVRSLDAHRRHRSRWLGGAAAAAVIAVVVGLAVRTTDSTDQSTASKSAATTIAAATANADAAARTEAAAAPTGADDAAPAAAPATTSGGAATTTVAAPSTIVAAAGGAAPTGIATSAAAIRAVDTPEQLLTIPAGPYAGTAPPPATPDGSVVTEPPLREATTTVALPVTVVATPAIPLTTCQVGGEVTIAVITYQGTPAVATVDAIAHVRRARAAADCTILAEIADPSS